MTGASARRSTTTAGDFEYSSRTYVQLGQAFGRGEKMLFRGVFGAFALFLAVGVASLAGADEKCWCKIIKSDCGDCSAKCVAHDYGAIAEFRLLQTKRNDLCKDACSAKLGAMSEPEVCAGLAGPLRVPMPWSGEVHGCARVGLL